MGFNYPKRGQLPLTTLTVQASFFNVSSHCLTRAHLDFEIFRWPKLLSSAKLDDFFRNFFFFFLVPNLEEEVAKLPDKDGWIRINEFMKFAMPLDLCKIEFHDRVFQKHDYDAEEKKAKQEAKEAAKSKKVNCPALSFAHQNFSSLQDPDLAYIIKNV